MYEKLEKKVKFGDSLLISLFTLSSAKKRSHSQLALQSSDDDRQDMEYSPSTTQSQPRKQKKKGLVAI